MNKVIILGSNGMLGHAVFKYFKKRNWSAIALDRSSFDILKNKMEDLKPYVTDANAIINCTGVIAPMIPSEKIENVFRINSVFPRNLAQFSSKLNIKCFHITSDAAYSGKTGNYSEMDPFDAKDVYGMTKIAGESPDCMVLRTSIIGEEKGKSRSLLEWMKSNKGKEVNGYTNHLWNGVTTIHLAETMERILHENIYQNGIFHIHSPETVSKFQLLELMNQIYQIGVRVNPIEAAESCNRSLKSVHSLTTQLCQKKISTQIQELRSFFLNQT